MYHAVKIEQLSENQISKLLRGQPVRVKHAVNGEHTLKLSEEQAKKVARAYKKGSGCNIQLDPYQIDNLQELKGTGLKSTLKKFAKKAFREGKKYVVKEGKKLGRKGLREAEKYLLDDVLGQVDRKARIKKQELERQYLRDDDREYYDAPFQDYDNVNGEGIGRFLKKTRKALRPVGRVAGRFVKRAVNDVVIPVAKAGLMASVMGAGSKRGRPPKRGGALRPAGGALVPAGY
jgi:hypothetical protein